MNSIKLNKGVIYNLIIIALVIYIVSLRQKEEEQIIVPSQENEMTVENPIEEQRFDTVIYKDSIRNIEVVKVVKVENPVNEDLLEKYEQAIKDNDRLKQISLYKEAITERKYNQVFEDSVQTITVKSEVIGTLKTQSVHYLTKPNIISVQKEPEKISLFAGGFAYGFKEPAFGLNLNLVNKEKNRIFIVGYDTKNVVHIGVTFKIY
ncbi:MAG: hypothetical protein PVG07_00110 [Acidobacteriota bacterium]|jgi:hypothetical protein